MIQKSFSAIFSLLFLKPTPNWTRDRRGARIVESLRSPEERSEERQSKTINPTDDAQLPASINYGGRVAWKVCQKYTLLQANSI
jgi:hypothetical protein